MGEAARKLAVDTSNTAYGVALDVSSIALRRPGKPLRAARQRTGNLIAFERCQDRCPAITKPACAPGINPPAVDFGTLQLSSPPISDDSFYHRISQLPLNTVRTRIAAGVLAALLVGAVITGTWMSRVTPEQASLSDVPVPVAQAPASNSASVELPEASPQNDALGQELEASLNLLDEYENQILQLKTEHITLLEDIESLQTESTRLSFELLQLDLTLARLESEAAEPAPKQTIYKTVDVPIGSGIENGDVVPYDNTSQIAVDGGYAGDESYAQDDSYDEYQTDDESEMYDESNTYEQSSRRLFGGS